MERMNDFQVNSVLSDFSASGLSESSLEIPTFELNDKSSADVIENSNNSLFDDNLIEPNALDLAKSKDSAENKENLSEDFEEVGIEDSVPKNQDILNASTSTVSNTP